MGSSRFSSLWIASERPAGQKGEGDYRTLLSSPESGVLQCLHTNQLSLDISVPPTESRRVLGLRSLTTVFPFNRALFWCCSAMTQFNGNRYRGETSREVRRRIQDEAEIIKVPAFDYSDLIEKFKLTLVGRMFHKDGRSVDALLKHMPRRRIWDVEGRVRGTNVGNNKFQLDFDKEEDLQKVLLKRPCHFNKWSFSLRDGSQQSERTTLTT